MEIIYWVILIFWVLILLVLKKDSSISLKIALTLFLLAAVLTVFNLQNLAEPVMRISFIGWLIGIFQALIEYKKKTE